MVNPIRPEQIKTSRKLRREQTPWEAKLWMHLRAKRVFPVKFKRQYVIGKYIVDFCSPYKKIIIELDGSQHNSEKGKIYDQERQNYLEYQGFKVLRFWNLDVDKNLQGILETILFHLKN